MACNFVKWSYETRWPSDNAADVCIAASRRGSYSSPKEAFDAALEGIRQSHAIYFFDPPNWEDLEVPPHGECVITVHSTPLRQKLHVV